PPSNVVGQDCPYHRSSPSLPRRAEQGDHIGPCPIVVPGRSLLDARVLSILAVRWRHEQTTRLKCSAPCRLTCTTERMLAFNCPAVYAAVLASPAAVLADWKLSSSGL